MRKGKNVIMPFRVAKIQQKWRFCQEKTAVLPEIKGNIWQLRQRIKNTEYNVVYPCAICKPQTVFVNSMGEKIQRGTFLTLRGNIYVPFDIKKHKTIDGILSTSQHYGLSKVEVYTGGSFVGYKLAEANGIRWYNKTYSLNNRDFSITGKSYIDLLEESGFDIHFCYDSVLEFLMDYYHNNDGKLKILDEKGNECNLYDLIAA